MFKNYQHKQEKSKQLIQNIVICYFLIKCCISILYFLSILSVIFHVNTIYFFENIIVHIIFTISIII